MLLPEQPIVKPAIPFVDTFVNDLHPGVMIIINGSTPPTANDFVINLALGPEFNEHVVRSPIAFHFNPRFHSNYVARNTLKNNSWGQEESSSPNAIFPFHKGQNFEIMILVTMESYMVAVNQKHYISFKHRIPYQQVTTLQILRDVNIERILLTDGPCTAPMPQPNESYTDKLPPSGSVTHNLAVPFETVIPGGRIRKGSVIYISGRPNPAADRFNIDLFFGGEYGRAGDVAFHFSVRFFDQVVVRNTKISDWWGEEERYTFRFPFEPSTTFDMRIICENDQFVVYVNGQHFCNYQHRLAYSQVDRFRVEGDVFIRSLMFN